MDISIIFEALTASLIDLSQKVGLACVGVIGAGLSIFAIRFASNKIMEFFYTLNYDGEAEDIYGRDMSDPEGWTEEDEREYQSLLK